MFHHIKFEHIDDYSWTEGHGEYHERYAKQREAAQAQISARAAMLAELGVIEEQGIPVIVNDEQILALVGAAVPFTVIRKLRGDTPLERFEVLAEKLLALPGLQAASYPGHPTTHSSYNEKVEVHMPGYTLATYNETMLCEDCCTDALQSHLDNGWRMITACPMPDQRRPDYILGRFNPNREISNRNGAAERG